MGFEQAIIFVTCTSLYYWSRAVNRHCELVMRCISRMSLWRERTTGDHYVRPKNRLRTISSKNLSVRVLTETIINFRAACIGGARSRTAILSRFRVATCYDKGYNEQINATCCDIGRVTKIKIPFQARNQAWSLELGSEPRTHTKECIPPPLLPRFITWHHETIMTLPNDISSRPLSLYRWQARRTSCFTRSKEVKRRT